MKTIGIIGGVTWHSTIEYYRLINQEISYRLGGCHSAKIVMISVDFDEHLRIHTRGGWEAVFNEMTEIGTKTKNAGVDFIILGANTLHRITRELSVTIGIPIINIADTVGQAISLTGLKKVGLIGTKYTMGEEFYKKCLLETYDIEVVVPKGHDFNTINRLIYDDLAYGNFGVKIQEECIRVIKGLEKLGVEGIILGCTELPKLVGAVYKTLPVFDTLKIHVQAAVDWALGE